MNKKVEFVENIFGIKLPNFELYTRSIKVEEIQKEKDGVTYPPKWTQEDGTLLPQEFETYLPKEGMTPEQAIEQLDVCSNLGFGWRNDSYKLYSQETMMQFIKTACVNCFYLASKDFAAWLKKDEDGISYLEKVESKIRVFNDGFSRQRPLSYAFEEQMRLRYLKLLLENDFVLNKGSYQSGYIFDNTLFINIFPNFFKNYCGNESLQIFVAKILQKKCYEIVEQLEKIK